jgi:hypothetical protein
MKRVMAAVFVLLFVVATASVSFGARLKCEVTSVDGDKVTMTCEDADKLKEGDKLKISPPKKGSVEGC